MAAPKKPFAGKAKPFTAAKAKVETRSDRKLGIKQGSPRDIKRDAKIGDRKS